MCGSWSQLGPHAPPLRSSGRGCKMKDKASTARPKERQGPSRFSLNSRPLLMLLMESWLAANYTLQNVPRWAEQYRSAKYLVAKSWRCARRRGSTIRLPAVQVPGAPAWAKHTHYGSTGRHYGARLLLWAATQSMESKRGWWSGLLCHTGHSLQGLNKCL